MKNDMVTIEVPEMYEYRQIGEVISRVLGVEIPEEKMLELMTTLGYHKFSILKMTQSPQQVAEMARFLLGKSKPADQAIVLKSPTLEELKTNLMQQTHARIIADTDNLDLDGVLTYTQVFWIVERCKSSETYLDKVLVHARKQFPESKEPLVEWTAVKVNEALTAFKA
jgi:hypothetical protein